MYPPVGYPGIIWWAGAVAESTRVRIRYPGMQYATPLGNTGQSAVVVLITTYQVWCLSNSRTRNEAAEYFLHRITIWSGGRGRDDDSDLWGTVPRTHTTFTDAQTDRHSESYIGTEQKRFGWKTDGITECSILDGKTESTILDGKRENGQKIAEKIIKFDCGTSKSLKRP